MKRKSERKKGLISSEMRPFTSWLPLVDTLRNQLSHASKDVIDTIVIAQSQMKDGFLTS